MKKLAILLILIITIASYADIMASRERMEQRGRACRYNYKGEVQSCDYIN